MPNSDLIGSAEAAVILGKSQRTVARLAASGALPIEQTIPGGYVGIHLYSRAAVEALKAQQEPAA